VSKSWPDKLDVRLGSLFQMQLSQYFVLSNGDVMVYSYAGYTHAIKWHY